MTASGEVRSTVCGIIQKANSSKYKEIKIQIPNKRIIRPASRSCNQGKSDEDPIAGVARVIEIWELEALGEILSPRHRLVHLSSTSGKFIMKYRFARNSDCLKWFTQDNV